MARVVDEPDPPAGVDQVPSPRQNVDDEADVPLLRLETDKLPDTPVDNGSPVAFVSVAEDGDPSAGVTRVGLVALTGAPEPVAVVQAGRADAPPPTRMSVVAPAASV